MTWYYYLRDVQNFLTEGKSQNEQRSEQSFKRPNGLFDALIIPFGAPVEYLPNSERIKPRIRQFGKKVLPGIFLGYALIAGGIWKEDILITDAEELENLDASEIYFGRLNAKEVLRTPQNGEFVIPVADGSAKLSRRDYEFQEPTLRRESTVKRENLSGESQGDREEFQPEKKKQKMTKESTRISGLTQKLGKNFIYRHHIEPRVQFFVPREESYPILLKYIDVIKSTRTDLDVVEEKRIDDNCGVDRNRNLPDSWTGFTRCTSLNETLLKTFDQFGGILTKIL